MINSTRLNCVSNFERDKEPFVRRMFTIRRTKDDAARVNRPKPYKSEWRLFASFFVIGTLRT